MKEEYISIKQWEKLCFELKDRIKDKGYTTVYGVPRGGCYIAMWLSENAGLYVTDILPWPNDKVLVVDDLIDSGDTRRRYKDYNFEVLIDKRKLKQKKWISFWYETNEKPISDCVRRILEALNQDPNRQGIKDTPMRVEKSLRFLTKGYEEDVSKLFTHFEQKYDEMVLVKDIDYFSLCEHHLLPFYGKVHIAYIPNGKVVGLSKLARVVEVYSRRLQIQERMTNEIAECIMKHLKPLGVGVIVEGKHLCMAMRGVQKLNSTTTTSSLLGCFRKQEVKNEFLQLIKN